MGKIHNRYKMKNVRPAAELEAMGLRLMTSRTVQDALNAHPDTGAFLKDLGHAFALEGPLTDLNTKFYASTSADAAINTLNEMCALALGSGTPMNIVAEWKSYQIGRFIKRL